MRESVRQAGEGRTWRGWRDEAARDWQVSPAVVTTIALVPFIVPLIGIAAGIAHRPTFDLLTAEDDVGEWLQVVAWLGALVFFAVVLVRLMRRRATLLAALYLMAAIGMIFIIGEEISWGQRVFGFGTPDVLQETNRQGEANVHNIRGVQTMFSWAMFAVGAYGTFAAWWVYRRWASFATWPYTARAIVPHWLLVPYFLLMLVWRTYRNLFEPVEGLYVGISEFGEITELILALGFLAFGWHQWRVVTPPDRPQSDPASAAPG